MLINIAGSRTSDTITSRSTTVPILQSAMVVMQDSSTLVNHGCNEKIADRSGSSMSELGEWDAECCSSMRAH